MSKSSIDSSQALLFRICGQTCSFLDFMRPCVSMNNCLAARKLMQGALFSVFFGSTSSAKRKKSGKQAKSIVLMVRNERLAFHESPKTQ